MIVCDSKGNLGFYNLIQERVEQGSWHFPAGSAYRPCRMARVAFHDGLEWRSQCVPAQKDMQERNPAQPSYGLRPLKTNNPTSGVSHRGATSQCLWAPRKALFVWTTQQAWKAQMHVWNHPNLEKQEEGWDVLPLPR